LKRFIAMKMCPSSGGIIFRSTPITLNSDHLFKYLSQKKGKRVRG
jgi:hypothetical protein